MFNSSYEWIDIVLTKVDIHALIDIIIIDPTWVNLLPWSSVTKGFAASNTAQTKDRNYRDQHPIDQFLLLAIEVFGC